MNFSNGTATAHYSNCPKRLIPLPMQIILHNRANLMIETFKKQLEGLIGEYQSAMDKSRHSDGSGGLTRTQVVDLITRITAAIERISGRDATYFRQIKEIGENRRRRNMLTELSDLAGIANALLSDIQNDYLSSFEETVHGDMFGDFLEMATQIIANKNKDAAAVLGGCTLEVHIRQLCAKYDVTSTLKGNPKKTDTLNAELVKAGAYSKQDQKNVTAWLALRNNATHGNYNEYTMGEVKIFIAGIRDFITRKPA